MPESRGTPATLGTVAAASARARVTVPVQVDGLASWHPAEVVTFNGLIDDCEHVAIVFDGWQDSHLVRVHSECLTGDVFGSARCDCGLQLKEAIALMADQGGVLLYLRQEGRGIGLYNKIDAYILQDRGLDTFEANEALNFAGDERSYEVAAQMLLALGLDTITLLTNNDEKVHQLAAGGITVEAVVPTGTFANEANHDYLKAKIDKAGHRLTLLNLELTPDDLQRER